MAEAAVARVTYRNNYHGRLNERLIHPKLDLTVAETDGGDVQRVEGRAGAVLAVESTNCAPVGTDSRADTERAACDPGRITAYKKA